jgi:hypothetical protein
MAKKKPLQENWDPGELWPWNRVTVTDRKLTRYTGVVWLKEKVRTHYEGSKGLEDLGGRVPLCPRNERTSSWTYWKIAKQKVGSYASSRKIKDWTLWRVDPFQNKQKKTLHIERKPVM